MNNPNSADGQPFIPVNDMNGNVTPYQYKGLAGNLAYPGPALPGQAWPVAPGTTAKQAAAQYHAEQNAINARETALKQADQARSNAATNRIRNGGRKGR